MKSPDFLAKSKTYEFGEYRLEAKSLSLFREKKIVQLPPKTVEVLLALVESGGRVVSRDEINERVWADTFVEEANLTHHISALRKTFGAGDGGQFIETIPRRGYRFIADVREIAADEAATTTEIVLNERMIERTIEEEVEIADAPQPGETIVAAPLAAPQIAAKKSSKRLRIAALAALSLVALAGIGIAFYKFLNPAPERFEAKSVTRLTSSGRVKLGDISPDGKFIIYSQEEMDGRQSLWLRHIGSESNAQIAAPAAIEYYALNISTDSNSFYYVTGEGTLFQMPILGGAAKRIADGISKLPYDTNIGISPDGKRIAFMRHLENEGNTIFIANADGTNEQRLITSEKLRSSLSWSPDGELIACRAIPDNGQNILVVRVADGTAAPVLPQGWVQLIKPAWLPDSKSLLALGSKDIDSPPRQIYQVGYPNGEARWITNDTNNYFSVSATSDGRFLASVRTEQVGHIWAMPSDDSAQARQLTDGFEKYDGLFGLNWTRDGKIVFDSMPSGNGAIWTIKADGGDSTQVVKGGAFPSAAPDGRFVVYQKGSFESGDLGLYLTDLTDGSERQLTKGVDFWTAFSPDGKWIVYAHASDPSGRNGLWKVSIESSEATPIFEGNATCPTVSPNGKTVAFVWRKAKHPPRIALVSSGGGEIIKTFDAKPESYPLSDKQNLQWTPNGSGIYFVAFNNGVSNIWRQPIDGSPPVQVTNFKDGRIFNFAFSPDGKQLALSRGSFNSDVVLIKNAQ